MQIEFELSDDIIAAILTGELDHHSTLCVRTDIDHAMEVYRAKHLVLDFSGVGFADSSGIGMIMGRYNKVKEKSGRIVLCGCSPYMKKILEMAGIFTIIPEASDRASAMQLLKERGEEDER